MDEASENSPEGVPPHCYLCGYDVRWTVEDEIFGSYYTPGLGHRHANTQDCIKVMTHYTHRKWVKGGESTATQ